MPESITIGGEPVTQLPVRRHKDGGYEVLVDVGAATFTSEKLCFGEMIEQVVGLLPPIQKHYPMKTQDDWDGRFGPKLHDVAEDA